MSLTELLSRVEAAQGADRNLDRDIVVALGFQWCHENWWDAPDPKKPFSGYWRSARLTSSLDAALNLCERALPGWGCRVERYPNGLGYAIVWREIGCAFTANAETPALALLCAMLRALTTSLVGDEGVSVAENALSPRSDSAEAEGH